MRDDHLICCRDPMDRITEGPSLGNDNPKLFSAYYIVLLALNNDRDLYDALSHFKNDLNNTFIEPGVYSRHPEDFRKTSGLSQNPMSHDELNGIAIFSGITGLHYIEYVLSYLKENSNCYDDRYPHFNPKTLFYKNPLKFFLKAINYFKDLIANPEIQDEIDQLHSPYIVALRYWKRPRDRYFYKACSKKNPTLIESFDFNISFWFSILFSYKKDQRNSGSLMNCFKMITLAKLIYNPTSGFEKYQIRFTILNWIMTKRLGIYWLHELLKKYFTNPYHPNHEHLVTETSQWLSF